MEQAVFRAHSKAALAQRRDCSSSPFRGRLDSHTSRLRVARVFSSSKTGKTCTGPARPTRCANAPRARRRSHAHACCREPMPAEPATTMGCYVVGGGARRAGTQRRFTRRQPRLGFGPKRTSAPCQLCSTPRGEIE
jgi:hypothetical protein